MRTTLLRFLILPLALLSFSPAAHAAAPTEPWWKPQWTARKKITIDTSDKGLAITDPIGTVPVLLRLSDNNFNFMGAKEDASDIRFVAADGKTVLKHHIEKFDSLLNEAYVWVGVPDVKPGAETTIWLYYGNATDAPKAEDPKGTYDADTTAVYHFSEAATAGTDSSAGGNAMKDVPPPVSGSVIGGGEHLMGQAGLTIPGSPSLEWEAGSSLTWSVWFKTPSVTTNTVLFSRREGAGSFVVGLDQGKPFAAVGNQRTSTGAPVVPGTWHHFAVVAGEGKITTYLDGANYGTVAAALPALKGDALIGKDTTAGSTGFAGDIDELNISKVARGAGFIKFENVTQGTSPDAQKLVTLGADEASPEAGGGEIMKQLSMIKDISKDLSFDGWVVIGLCSLLAVIGWGVAFMKLLYLNKINKATAAFMQRWKKVSGDLTALDAADEESIKTMGGTVSAKAVKLMRHSPMYHIYHLGSDEIRQRIVSGKTNSNVKGLSGRSIQAIKATLHGGLMREVQKLNSKLVFLTIGIAGGPYLGLLGTVIGVMITFATIAKSGQVEVNSIAPGIAGALLATVAGLAVAIPALFAYSYLSSRIKDAVTDMETFIDEFIARMAEHHKEA